MRFLKIILVFGGMCFCLSANAQLEWNTVYEIEFLEAEIAKAAAEKDSAALGMAAFILSAHLEWEEGMTSKIVDLMTLSIKCFASIGDSANYYRVLPEMAEHYIESKLYQEAEKMLLDARNYYDRLENWQLKMHMASRLGYMHERIGNVEKAKKFKEESHRLNQFVKDTLLDIIYYLDKIPLLQNQEKFDSALLFAHKSLALSQAINRDKFIALSLFNIGIQNQFKNNLDTAIFYLKKAEKRDRPIDYSSLRLSCFRHLSDCYELRKDFQNAHQYLHCYSALNDSILNKSRLEALDQMTVAFETKEKQVLIDALEKENELIEERNFQKTLMLNGLSVLLLILGVLSWFLIRFYREKSKKDKIIAAQTKNLNQQKIESLENEMRLSSVKSMLEGQEKERIRIARDLHDSLGGLLSTIKLQLKSEPDAPDDPIRNLLDEAATEVRLIAQNLQPSSLQQLGLIAAIKDLITANMPSDQVPKINFQHYNFPEKLNPTSALQIYRIIQEALNNALKHAEATEILIQLNGEPEGISILIEDDGKGFDQQKIKLGDGLENIRKRAEFLGAELTLESNEHGTTMFLVCQI